MKKIFFLLLLMGFLMPNVVTESYSTPYAYCKKNKKSKGSSSSSSSNKKSSNVEKGEASYYADKFNGRTTASGEIFSNKKMTAAHKTLPFGTMVRVTNTANGKSVDVRINDRGPFVKGRIIDLSKAAAEKIGMVQAGVANVTVEVLK